MIIFGEDARAPVQDVNWLLREGNVDQYARLVVLRVNNVYGIFRAVELGLGIASLPDYLARESTKIEMRAARPECPYDRCVFHVSRGIAAFQAHRRVPRFPVAEGRRDTFLRLRPAVLHSHERHASFACQCPEIPP